MHSLPHWLSWYWFLQQPFLLKGFDSLMWLMNTMLTLRSAVPGPPGFHPVGRTVGWELLLTWLQKKEISPAEINPPISLGRKSCSPHVGLLSTLLPLLNNRLDKGKHSLSSSKRALCQKYISWPKAAVQIQMQTRRSSTGEEGWA